MAQYALVGGFFLLSGMESALGFLSGPVGHLPSSELQVTFYQK
jgi:hypothetical protein